ncbi:amino acid permease [bacterium]|nr:amino acid permease [bacterium]
MRSHKFSFLTATLLVVANCIGTGIFTTTGFLLADLKNPLLVLGVWVLAALYAFLGVRCYQKLHDFYPGSGGEYHFLHEGWHAGLGKAAGFVSLIAGFSAPIAASAMGFALYLQKFTPVSISPFFIASFLIVIIVALQVFYSDLFLRSHNILVTGKLLGLFLLVLSAFYFSDWNRQQLVSPEVFPVRIFAHSFFWCAYAFSGWNAVYYVAGEVLHEKSLVHRASLLGAAGVVVLYLALNIALLFTGDPQLLAGQTEVVAEFLKHTMGDTASQWLSLFIAFGLISTTSALLITGPRVYARMAQDGALPRLFKSIPGKIPKASLLLQMTLSLFILWTLDFDKILHRTGFVLTLCSALAVSVLLKKSKPSQMTFWQALLFCSLTLWLAIAGYPS